MADSKISALTDGNPAQSGDEIPIARSGANYKITAGSIASLGGDVDGPASSTDNAVARFDSTTGKLIQNSGVTIDDSNNLTLPGQADLRFADSDSSNWVAFQAPATVASNVTWTLPNADGTSGQVLSTDGSGTLSWATGGGGGGSGTVTSVAFSAGTTGLSVSGSPITTSGTITLAGTLGVANGGTGATTLTGLVKGSGTSAFSAATAGTDYVAPAGAFSGLSWQSVQTTGFTAVAFRAYPCNTTSAAFTVTLPASPSAGDQITLTDYAGTWNTNNLTVSPNGLKINGSTSNIVLVSNRNSVQLVYIDSTQGWLIYSGWNPATIPVQYLVVGGGGGGGALHGGGGGAGGLLSNISGSPINVSSGSLLTITVGTGGAGSSNVNANTGAQGAVSSIAGTGLTTISATGGGGGGGRNQTTGAPTATTTGGSGGGGGGGTSAGSGAAGTSGQGNTGGNGSSAGVAGNGGGGGGAGFAGGNATGTTSGAGSSGAGGDGLQNAITGTNTYYAGGGAGGRWGAGTIGAAGQGGGGTGSIDDVTGGAGTNGLGGGGGGGGGGTTGFGGKGGDGVVIIRYPDSYPAATSTTGSPTITNPTGYRVYKWTGNGSITF